MIHRNHLIDLHNLSQGKKGIDIRTEKLDPWCGYGNNEGENGWDFLYDKTQSFNHQLLNSKKPEAQQAKTYDQ